MKLEATSSHSLLLPGDYRSYHLGQKLWLNGTVQNYDIGQFSMSNSFAATNYRGQNFWISIVIHGCCDKFVTTISGFEFGMTI